jgi:hypothetical protein
MSELLDAMHLPAWVRRAADLRHKPWFGPTARFASRAFTAALVVLLLWKLTQLGWARLWRERPVSLLFYALLLLSYFVQPLGEWIVFRRLWRGPIPFMVCLRKRVLSNAVFSYSGEAYLFLWARKHLSLPHATLLHAVKDSSLLSGAASLVVLLTLLAGLGLDGAWRLPALTRDFSLFYWVIASVPVFTAAAFLFARRRITALSGRDVAFVFSVHLLRNLATQLLQVMLWVVALPGVPLPAWLNFLAARLLVMQISFLPSGNLFQLTAGIGLAGAIGLPQLPVTAVLLFSAAAFQGLHFLVLALDAAARSRYSANRAAK